MFTCVALCLLVIAKELQVCCNNYRLSVNITFSMTNGRNSSLKFIRRTLGKTQKEFGELLGLGASGYAEIESGRVRLTSEAIQKLSAEFNLDPRAFTSTEGPGQLLKYFPTEPLKVNEPGEAYGTPPNLTLLEIEKERLSRELEAYKAENAELRKLIQNR
jgi:transcriptional regulator with XRE-family HTH domain